jgi:hypothetical protein
MQVYIGIDWSEKKHDVVFMNAVGGVITRLTIELSISGIPRQKRLGMTFRGRNYLIQTQVVLDNALEITDEGG